jgi:hypothetical protein
MDITGRRVLDLVNYGVHGHYALSDPVVLSKAAAYTSQNRKFQHR